MSYTPKSEEQLIREGLLPDDIYDYTVADTDDAPSKAGNTMFTLKLHVFDESGNVIIVNDYIALGSNFGERKLRHAADASGIIDIYDAGNLVASDFKGKSGRLYLKTQEGTKEYPNPKNVVSYYMKRETAENTIAAKETIETGAILTDDEIPF